MTSDNEKEMFPLVDEEGNITGSSHAGRMPQREQTAASGSTLARVQQPGRTLPATPSGVERHPARQMGHVGRRTHRLGRECGNGTGTGSTRRIRHYPASRPNSSRITSSNPTVKKNWCSVTALPTTALSPPATNWTADASGL